MEFTITEIVFIAIAAILAVALVVVIFKNNKYLIRATRRIDNHYSTLLNIAQNENRRISTLYNNLKKQSSTQKPLYEPVDASKIVDVERLAAQQKELEAQQMELADRNHQLWDMSVNIEKERQHIQTLKSEIDSQHRAVTSSIRYAKLIQNAALPSDEILKESFQDVFLLWRPRDIVSGDFYWMKRIGDTVIFSVADCTGHGVPGGFMSMLGVAFLNDICVNFTPDTHPAQILEELRQKVISTLKQDDEHIVQKDGMDIALCVLNLATMKMQFAGANNGMYHVRGSQLTEYKPIHNPIGSYPRLLSFENRDVEIQHGDYVYMFSDGYTDQLDPDNHMFTQGRLRKLLCEINAITKVAAQQAEMLNDAFDQWRKGNNQMDDILIGGYCIK